MIEGKKRFIANMETWNHMKFIVEGREEKVIKTIPQCVFDAIPDGPTIDYNNFDALMANQ